MLYADRMEKVMKRAYVDILEGQMHYRFAGTGKPVILLHMSGSSSDEFDAAGDILSREYCVYAPDLLAFGYSDNPPRIYTLEEHAKTIIEFMDALKIKEAGFVGNLVGANIAVHAARICPLRVKQLILFSFCYGEDFQEFQKIGKLPVYQPIPMAEDGSHLLEMWKRTQRYHETTEVVAARTLCMHMAGEWSESLHTALFSDIDLTDVLREIEIPVKLLGNPEEKEKTRIVSRLLQDVKFEIVAKMNPFFDRKYPDEFSEIVKKSLIQSNY